MSGKRDSVAEKSSFLCMYMSGHPDTLVAYVKYYGKVKETVASAKMSSIDSNVSCKLHASLGLLFTKTDFAWTLTWPSCCKTQCNRIRE